MPYVTGVVYFDLRELTDDELLEEVNSRNLVPVNDKFEVENLVRDIYQRRQLGLGYEQQLADLFDKVLGRIA